MQDHPRNTPAADVRHAAVPLTGQPSDLDPLLDVIGDAHFVLIGEASHGTSEFYERRAEITRRLILEKGFTAVAAEADWPDAYRVNRYVRGLGDDADARQALGDFKRFPSWMWRNTVVLDFVGWLRQRNDGLPAADRAGFYGLDLYSLYTSIEAVIAYLDRVDPPAAQRARQRYSCFERFGTDEQTYGWATSLGLSQSCEDDVVRELTELRRHYWEYASRDGRLARDEAFYAEQNARLVKDAEEYYRSMFRGSVESWNLRDRHMADTLDALAAHLVRDYGGAKVAVWAHNSHVGDARATQLGAQGEWNVGQLARERHPGDSALVGFTTYSGTVTAASDWGGPAERKRVRPGMAGSFEELFHAVGIPRFLLSLRPPETAALLRQPRLERAIGVVYLPETERQSHYFYARLADQFDAVIHLDETHAVEPLERTSEWEAGEVPETFPSAL